MIFNLSVLYHLLMTLEEIRQVEENVSVKVSEAGYGSNILRIVAREQGKDAVATYRQL